MDSIIAAVVAINDYSNFKAVGQLYAPTSNNDLIDDNILKVFSDNNKRLKIICALGSYGKVEKFMKNKD